MRLVIQTSTALFLVLIISTATVIQATHNLPSVDNAVASSSPETLQLNRREDSQQPTVNALFQESFGEVKLVAISPVKFSRLINKNSSRWDKDGIYEELDLQAVRKELSIESGYLERCEADCDAKVFEVELDNEPGEEVLLKLTKSLSFCRYLLFKRADYQPSHSIFLGYIDHYINKYELTWHRGIKISNKHFLVIRGQTGSGTGFSSYYDTWYEVSMNKNSPKLYCARAYISVAKRFEVGIEV